jgi:hypothetical protein
MQVALRACSAILISSVCSASTIATVTARAYGFARCTQTTSTVASCTQYEPSGVHWTGNAYDTYAIADARAAPGDVTARARVWASRWTDELTYAQAEAQWSSSLRVLGQPRTGYLLFDVLLTSNLSANYYPIDTAHALINGYGFRNQDLRNAWLRNIVVPFQFNEITPVVWSVSLYRSANPTEGASGEVGLHMNKIYVFEDPLPQCSAMYAYPGSGPYCYDSGPEPLSRVNYWSDSTANNISGGQLVPEPNSLFLVGAGVVLGLARRFGRTTQPVAIGVSEPRQQ